MQTRACVTMCKVEPWGIHLSHHLVIIFIHIHTVAQSWCFISILTIIIRENYMEKQLLPKLEFFIYTLSHHYYYYLQNIYIQKGRVVISIYYLLIIVFTKKPIKLDPYGFKHQVFVIAYLLCGSVGGSRLIECSWIQIRSVYKHNLSSMIGFGSHNERVKCDSLFIPIKFLKLCFQFKKNLCLTCVDLIGLIEFNLKG